MRQQLFASPEEALDHYQAKRLAHQPKPESPEEALAHFGVKGMRWGVRKSDGPPGVPHKINKMAKKDAEEFTRAKLYFGEGAGTRRKLIKAKIEERSKDRLYKKALDYHVKKTDLAKRANQAKNQRKRTDVTKTVKKTARKSGLNDIVRDAVVRKLLEQDGLNDDGRDKIVGTFDAGADFLAHHGVKGMRWGVRKSEDTSGRDSGQVGNPALAILGVYAALILGVRTYVKVQETKDSGIKYEKQNKDIPWKKNSALSKKIPPMTEKQLHDKVVKQINSDFGAKGTKMNCRRCTLAYEMRRRGNDVKATPSLYASGQDLKGLSTATTSFGGSRQAPQSIWGHNQIGTREHFIRGEAKAKSDTIFSTLNKQPNGSRGELAVGWKMGGGHSMAYEVIKGKAVVIDTQSSKMYRTPRDFDKFASTTNDAAYTRTDNVKLNEQYLRRWMTNND